MKIFNLNVNDFGGTDKHLEEYKQLYGSRWYTKKWDDIDKTNEIKGIIECIERHTPDIIILEEYDINSKEAQSFETEMKAMGYVLEAEITPYKRPSMTVFFIKTNLKHSYVKVGHTKNGRAYAIKVKDVIFYGTHIPPKFDKEFWSELHSFINDISSNKYILIGDFNTINYKNLQELDIILENAIDVWKAKGNSAPISIMGDYVIVSKNIDIDNIEIQSFDEKKSDHPVINITIEDKVFETKRN